MNVPTRRRILTAIAAVPTLALPAVAGGGKHDARVAIEVFQKADAEVSVAREHVKALQANLKAAEAELVEADRRYHMAAPAVTRALRVLLQRPV